jgi:hypothetical protein
VESLTIIIKHEFFKKNCKGNEKENSWKGDSWNLELKEQET